MRRYQIQRATGAMGQRFIPIVCGARLPRFALALIFTALTQASAADPTPVVESFSPQDTIKNVRQVTARFSMAMVTFGDPRLPEPFIIDCPSAGHRARVPDL